MTTKLASGVRVRGGSGGCGTPSHRVEALVTFAAFAWFTAVLSVLAGEWRPVAPAPQAQPAAVVEVAAVQPRVPAPAGVSLI